MNSINIYDYLQLFNGEIGEHNKLVNLRGTNGSGKSSVPFSFINRDKDAFELTYQFEGKDRVLATVCPNEGWLFLGAYRTKCGGLDYYKTVEQTIDSLHLVLDLPYNILMEGVISSTIFSTYANLFTEIVEQGKRDVIIATLLPPLDTCLQRIQSRNGGKEVKRDQVEFKYNTVKKNVQKFQDAGLNSIILDNSCITLEQTRNWFLSEIGLSVEEVSTNDTKDVNFTANGLFLPQIEDIRGYEWFQYYTQPNDAVEVNWDNMRMYWYWIAERMNIWYKRTVLGELAPWTEDKILRNGKFTNAIRDLDRGTVIYINEILKKIDEPCDDLEKRKKEIILNTMIYRLFIRKETWDCIGFLYLDTWEEQWSEAVRKLRERRAAGHQIFHGAYYVFGLHTASPSPDNHDKTENAINLIENFWKPKLDEIYEKVTTLNMKDLLNYLETLCCVGRFSAYEYICDWAMCHRHTVNTITDWDDDSYVNIGPGNKKGLDFIFTKSGNLSDVEKDMYLRATWKYYMKKYGFYDQFISQLPDWMNGDINLRVIEHDCCEYQKYANVYYGTGRLKASFTPETTDVKTLII